MHLRHERRKNSGFNKGKLHEMTEEEMRHERMCDYMFFREGKEKQHTNRRPSDQKQ